MSVVVIIGFIIGSFFVGAIALGQFREENKLVGVLMILGWCFVTYMFITHGLSK